MSSGILVKSGGGGTTSEDVTAKLSDNLVGKTGVASDSGDEIGVGTLCSDATLDAAGNLSSGVIAYGKDGARIVGSMENMNGGTWTPNASNQTVQCAGKKMNSNIVIGAVPSSFVPTNSAYIYNYGWGGLVNRGVDGKGYSTGAVGTVTGLSNNRLPVIDSNKRLSYNMASNDNKCAFVTVGSINMTPFKTIRWRLYGYTVSATSTNFNLLILNTSKTIVAFKRYYISGPKTQIQYSEESLDISGVNGQCFVSLYMGYGGAGMTNIGVDYIRLMT